MKITYIKTIGFRKFEKEFESNLYDITSITGGNRKGKTNILYAIIWAFLGTNLTGDDKVWLGNKNSDDCYVELNFIDNQGNTHNLIRYKNKFDNKNNFIALDNKKIESDILQSFYMDKKLFLSIMNFNYFIFKKPAEQKELIDKYLPQLDINIVYNKLDNTEKSYLEGIPTDIIEYLKELNSAKKMYEDKIKNLKGKIDYAINITDTEVSDKKSFEKAEELLLAKQELSYLTSETTKIDKEKQQKIVDSLSNQIMQIEQQIGNYTVELTTGKNAYLSIKSESNSICPMCEQKIANESKISTIKNMKIELEKTFNKKKELEKDLLNLKSSFVTERCKLHSLEGKQNVQKEQQITTLEIKIKTLEQEQLEIEKYNTSILVQLKSAENAKEDIELFKRQIKEQELLIENVKQTKKVTEKLYINYIEEKMQYATKHLNDVEIKYYSVLKESGEIKDDFIIIYKDNEFKNLSRSETIATSLELCNMFNKISGINIPLFIDDNECCADYNFIQDYSKGTQILIAEVKKGQDLIIKDKHLKEVEYLQVA